MKTNIKLNSTLIISSCFSLFKQLHFSILSAVNGCRTVKEVLVAPLITKFMQEKKSIIGNIHLGSFLNQKSIDYKAFIEEKWKRTQPEEIKYLYKLPAVNGREEVGFPKMWLTLPRGTVLSSCIKFMHCNYLWSTKDTRFLFLFLWGVACQGAERSYTSPDGNCKMLLYQQSFLTGTILNAHYMCILFWNI